MRKIIHIDMDCFYAAVEMREDPSLRYIPMAVGGKAERRGVISTANYIARRYGIHSAMPTAQALKLCPQLKVVAGRMPLYKEISQQIHRIFQRYTSIIEPLSLDEAYLDVTDTTLLHGSATLIAQEIRQKILEELGLTASAGVAPLKFLAKIASDINKPNGLFVITPKQMDDFILQLPLKKLPGVGSVTAKKLADLGLISCADVRNYDLAELLRRFGKLGRILYERCNAIDPRIVNNERQRKSVGVETTLTKDIYDWPSCLNVVETLFPELETRLARAKPDLRIARQGVKLKFDDFRLTTQEHVWPLLCKDDLINIAYQIWHERRGMRGVRLVGLHVTLMDPMIEKQLSFSAW